MAPLFGKKPKPDRRRDYETIGKQVAALYDAVNPDRTGLYRTAFLKGVATGVGGVVGATLVIVIIAWVLSLFEQIPFIGPIFEGIKMTIQSK